MYPFHFSLVRPNGLDIIRVSGTPVYLTVYPADHPGYLTKSKEKQFYCQHKDQLLIFETTGYTPLINPMHLQALYSAIKWYGQKKFLVQSIEIRLTDPRRSGVRKREK